MVEIFGEIYYIDFEIIDKFLLSDPNLKARKVDESQTTTTYNNEDEIISKVTIVNTTEKQSEINGVRYDIIRTFIDEILSANIDSNEKLEETTTGFKLAFNTLIAYQILKPIE